MNKIKKGLKFEGKIYFNKNQKLAYVRFPEEFKEELEKNKKIEDSVVIYFDDTEKSFSGDTVAIELIGQVVKGFERAIVTELVERKQTKFVGTVDKSSKCFVVPDNYKMHIDLILPNSDCANVEHDDRIYVEFTKWETGKKNPEVKLVENLGKKGTHDVEMRAIVLEKGFDADFPTKVLKEAEDLKNKWKNIPEKEIELRRDIRETTTFTIDPADAKDFDDALSFKKLDNGNYEIGIHIADVAHYVTPGTELDKEGSERAFSVYLVDRTIPMLPEVLSNDLCSLNPNEDKLAFSAIFEINEEAQIKEEWFGRSVIKSDKRFTYEGAQRTIDSEDTNEEYYEELNTLNVLSKKLGKQNEKNGAIKFTNQEFQFELDQEGVPVKINKKEPLDTHKLIEQFMLLANRHVAQFIYKKCTDCPLMYRVHQVPDVQKIGELSIFVKALGYKLEVNKEGEVEPWNFNKLLAQVAGKPEESLISSAAIKTMTKAIYSTENNGHFGLAFDFYTHFTSPIRRYPDLVVHRILDKLLKEQEITEKEHQFFDAVAKHSSEQEVMAQDAERTSIKYKQVEFMQNHVGEEFDGIISGVAPFGIFVVLKETGAEGMVHISKFGEDYWQHEEKNYRIVGRDSRKTFTLGDEVKIKIEKANLDDKKLEMSLV